MEFVPSTSCQFAWDPASIAGPDNIAPPVSANHDFNQGAAGNYFKSNRSHPRFTGNLVLSLLCQPDLGQLFSHIVLHEGTH